MNAGPIIVHDLDDAERALAAAAAIGRAVTLLSAPGAGRYLGAAVFRDMVEEARAGHRDVDVTAVFDCGDDPGVALGALRHGLKVIRVDVAPETRARIADIASQSGARLDDGGGGPALDLLDLKDAEDPDAALREWLARGD